MRNKSPLKIFATLVVASQLFVQVSAATQIGSEAIEAAKAAAAAAARSGANKQFKYDENGEVIRDDKGNPVLENSSPEGWKNALRDYQKTTGLSGVENVSGKLRTGSGGMASVKLDHFFDFSCSSDVSRSFIAGYLSFKVAGCEGPPNSVSNVKFLVCDEVLNGGVCDTASSYDSQVVIPANNYSSFNGMELGLGCTSAALCRLSVKGSYVVGATASTIDRLASEASEKSAAAKAIRQMVSSDGYTNEMKEFGQSLADCSDKNANSGNTGVYKSCDGKATVTLDTPNKSSQCTAEPVCEREAVNVSTFERSCQRTFPLTERTNVLEYTRTATCELVSVLSDTYGKSTNSCEASGAAALNEGMAKVGETEKTCTKTVDLKDAPGTCVEWKQTQYWVDTANPVSLGVSEAPAPVGGACDTTGATSVMTCESDWFGRTLPLSECTATYTDDDGQVHSQLWGNAQKPGCGFCLKPKVGQTCYAAPAATNDGNADALDTCGGVDLTGCALKSVTPSTFSGDEGGGLVTSQNEVYTCQRETKQCVKWSAAGNDPACIKSDMTYGTDKIGSKPDTLDPAFTQAMTSLALAEAVSSSAQQEQDQTVPLLFGGSDQRCKRPVGSLGSIASKNCCRTDLERPKKGTLTQAGCTLDEAKLAAARRSNYAHYVGDYCSKRLPFPSKSCTQRKQTYCVFSGILPKLIQEQGREQIASILNSSQTAEVQSTSKTFDYYSSTDSGNWSEPATVNGTEVRAWQWPRYCSDEKLAAEKYLENAAAKECPSVLTTHFAVCDLPGGCGAIPNEPAEGSLSWSLTEVDPLQNKTTAVSKYAVVSGACTPSTQQCSYSVRAWPAGVGGKVVVTKDLIWTLFQEYEQNTTAGQSAQAYQLNNLGDLMFRMHPTRGAQGGVTAMPETVRLGFSRDGGQTWKDVALPTTGIKNTETTLPDSDVKITGLCDAASNLCSYRVTGTASISGKYWGNPKAPDCSGFTAGQLSVLDFGKMDLSEWTSTLMDKINGGETAKLGEKAAAQVKNFQEVFSSGKVRGTAPSAVNFARAIPAEGFGPFKVKLVVSGFWPEFSSDESLNQESVTAVSVKWGDCTEEEPLQPAAQGKGYAAEHVYDRPDSDKHFCLRAGAGDDLKRNLTHNVELKVLTRNLKSGATNTYTRAVKVENAWAVFPGGSGNNDDVTQTVIVPTLSPSGPGVKK